MPTFKHPSISLRLDALLYQIFETVHVPVANVSFIAVAHFIKEGAIKIHRLVMETTKTPYLLDLQFRGFIEGTTIKNKQTGKEICHYFGGLPYGLPPIGPFRWKHPRALPPCYRYGTRANPGSYTGSCSVCPQERASPLDDENCLQCNIWIPAGESPIEGSLSLRF